MVGSRGIAKRIHVLILWALLVGTVVIGIIWYQAQWRDVRKSEYVAMGSSFAAGAGLGRLQPGSPWLCARSVNGYPQQLAHMLGLSIADMSCGGAVTAHLLHGGQFFQGPQIQAVSNQTRYVTITVGGNDIGYIGDMSMLAARNSGSLFGKLVNIFWGGPRPERERDYRRFETELTQTIGAIRKLSQKAQIVLVSYPTILPRSGTCREVGLNIAQANMMRDVADRLAISTRNVAQKVGALLVDMHVIAAQHNACSAAPWTRGWSNGGVSPFHPSLEGAKATARQVKAAIDSSKIVN